MSTRREFLKQTAAAGVIAAAAVRVAGAAEENVSPKPSIKTAKPAHKAPRVASVTRVEETVLRYGGVGDGLTMTWAADDRQLVALQDGIGWGPKWLDKKSTKRFYNSRLLAISGGPRDAVFHDVPGYPELAPPPEADLPSYYGFGTLALDGHIYQFLSTLNQSTEKAGSRWIGAKLIYSPDNGRTWRNQDGSTPVVWEPWERRSRDSMFFFDEPQESFSLLTVLQMGRNYEYNRDRYVYLYAPNGNTDGTMSELVMLRVPKTRILERRAYEYFAGLTRDGGARWAKAIDARVPVYTFPRGWVNLPLPGQIVVESWLPSVTYNAPLGVYMMAATGVGPAPDRGWFGKPSYLGFWVAPNPWGPWTQIHEETAWMPEGDKNARALDLQIAPKWIAPDGKSFWMVWSEFQGSADMFKETQTEAMRQMNPGDRAQATFEIFRRCMPYYAFNTQRVDFVLA